MSIQICEGSTLQGDFEQTSADGTTAGRNYNLVGMILGCVGNSIIRHVSRIGQHRLDPVGQRKCRVKGHEIRVSMDENMVEVFLQEPAYLVCAARLVLADEDVADRRHDDGTMVAFACGTEEWQELESHLAPPEGKQLDHQDIRADVLKGVEHGCAALCTPQIVDGRAVLLQKFREIFVMGVCGRQLNEPRLSQANTRYCAAAGQHRHVETLCRRGASDHSGPLVVADTYQVLNVNEDACRAHIACREADGIAASAPTKGMLRAWTVGFPWRSTANTCAHVPIELFG